jgi:hypothetical protein
VFQRLYKECAEHFLSRQQRMNLLIVDDSTVADATRDGDGAFGRHSLKELPQFTSR